MDVSAHILAVVATATIALAGCTSGGGASSSGASSAGSASPSTTPVATLSASPSPSAPAPSASAATGDCSTDGIVPGRLGCLDTNLPVAGNPGESAVSWEADHCSAGDGRFVFTAAPTLVGLGGEGGGKVGRIDVYDPSLTTAEGIHVGSTAADVATAYPAHPAVTSFSGTKLVVLTGAEGFVTIELADGWGAEPWTVANIRIYATDQDANVPVYGTEDFAGACPMDF
ncbi:hypothetical protein [Demequina lutea]|uniref:Uncharacterized protein n=1 Tax=Demequina lutea TaxID=431489 RepID=A0A7Z0CIU4_9MICO|nr:hypothetical protein [Demequina lutea]NYI40243.1 hypothetical protein [Demequina lutea]